MEMNSEQRIPASRDEVWAALNDTAILKQAMPGCESFDAIDDNVFEAKHLRMTVANPMDWMKDPPRAVTFRFLSASEHI